MELIEKVIEFLDKKPGYSKEGGKRLSYIIEKQLGILIPQEDCKEAIKIVNACKNKEKDTAEAKGLSEIPEGFKVKSKWQAANGEWLMSLERDKSIEEEITVDYKDVFKDIINSKPSDLFDHPKVESDLDFNSNNYKDLKVWTSDKHIGAKGCEGNEYSAEEFKHRMALIYLKISDMVAENGVFDTITIVDLGDAIDGMDNFTVSRTHKLKQNMNNIEMFETYFSVHKEFIDNLYKSGFAKNYQLWLVTNSNHGGDFEYVCHSALLSYVEGVYPSIKVVNMDKFLNHVEHKNIHYILSHGKDKENRFKGLPLFPTPQAETLIEAYLKRINVPRQARIRLIKGDLHQSCSAPCKNIEVYKTVSSILGSSEWVLDNFELTAPGCDYEVLDMVTGDIIEGKIKF